MKIEDMLKSLTADEQSIQIVADYLGYSVGRNPNEPESEWRMLFTNKIPDKTSAVIALKTVPNLTLETKTMDIRKLHKQVEGLAVSFGGSFDAEIAGFVGQKRIVLFRLRNGNRDERLDLNEETIRKVLYLDNFNMLKNSSITVEQDDFWGGYVIHGLKDVFKRELTNHFLSMVALYRKKLSELITSKPYKNELASLVSDNARAYIIKNALTQLVEDESYTAVLSNVVDTMILRQLMRRFIEAYYGKDEVRPFELSGIALGVGRGTLDEAIKETVEIYSNLTNSTESAINKLNEKKNVIEKYDDYVEISLFDEDEYDVTSKIKMKDDSKKRLIELHNKATQQFKTLYGGDLFASSVGEVTTKIENLIVEHDAEMWAKFWIDTSSENYSFRFEDVPPEALEKQYENSMSQNVQIKIEDGKPIVFYGEDSQEQKNKGAYYTDEKFVQYMVQQTVEVEFQNRIALVKGAINEDNESEVIKTLDHLFDMKTADLTAGGGSFLRGAFRQLADKHDALVGLKVTDTIREKYPMMQAGDEGIFAWEKYIMHNMVYGVDIDYKAILISSLTLMLSSLQHRPIDQKLPELIGNTLIHQNSLMNSVPFYERETIYANYQKEIKTLLKLKREQSLKFENKRQELQRSLLQYVQPILNGETQFLHVEALEVNFLEVFFDENGLFKRNAGFDCIFGNPPWESWKMNYDELYKKYDINYKSYGNSRDKEKRKAEIIRNFPYIVERLIREENKYSYSSKLFDSSEYYPDRRCKINGRYPPTEINLYKVSTERFLQLLKFTGKLSILVPDSLMTDIGSTAIRKRIINDYDLKEFLSFDNKLGIFKAVDKRQRFAILTLSKNDSLNNEFDAFFYRYVLDDLYDDSLKIKYDKRIIREFEPEKLSLFEPRNSKEFDIYVHLKKFTAPLSSTRLINFRIEYNAENRYKKFVYEPGNSQGIPMLKGENFNQFQLVSHSESSFDKQVIIKKIGEDVKSYRIALRRNARPTDKRTLICTLLPPYITASGSVLVQRESYQMSLEERLFYLGILNSYLMDFFLRKIIQKNVSQTFIDQLPVPSFQEFNQSESISDIVYNLLQYDKTNKLFYEQLSTQYPRNPSFNLEYIDLIALLNAKIFLYFQLTREQVLQLMKDFESVNHKFFVQEETQRIIEVYDRLKAGEA